jgi:hypothetical protein
VTANPAVEALRARWLVLTKDRLPSRARAERWPLREDHCFQRVLLDAACGGRWYDHVPGRPAYRHLDADRLGHAVALAERLAVEPDAATLLRELDARSLAWRGKRPKPAPPAG